MVSFGRSDLIHESVIIGKIEVSDIRGIQATGPRLFLQVKHELRPSPVRFSEPPWEGPVGNYEILDLTGELRLGNNGPSLGLLVWMGRRAHFPSSKYGSGQVQLICDLDWPRLERLEQYRDGKGLLLIVDLWPLALSRGQGLNVYVEPFQVKIERDTWMKVLEDIGYGRVDILEVPRDTVEQATAQRAVTLLREAQGHIGRGYFDEAARCCRHVLEAVGHAFEIPARSTENPDPWKTFLCNLRDRRIAGEYASIASRLKQLTGFTHHEPKNSTPPNYSRQEALFLVRSTGALVGLISDLVARHSMSQNS